VLVLVLVGGVRTLELRWLTTRRCRRIVVLVGTEAIGPAWVNADSAAATVLGGVAGSSGRSVSRVPLPWH
jgi:hypothetical protein